MAQTTQQAKLCPHCANSIALDAVKCPYCKAQLGSAPVPEWAERGSDPVAVNPIRSDEKSGAKSKIIGAIKFPVRPEPRRRTPIGVFQHPD